MTRPLRNPNRQRIASRAFTYHLVVSLSILGLIVWSGEVLSGGLGIMITAGFAMAVALVTLPIVVFWDESVADSAWPTIRGWEADRALIWPLLAFIPFSLLNWEIVSSELDDVVSLADDIVAFVGTDLLSGPAETVAFLVALVFAVVLVEVVIALFSLLVMAIPALAVSWTRLFLEGRDPFWTRRRKGVAVAVVLLLAAPTVAGAVGGYVAGPSDTSEHTDGPSPGDFRNNMALGSYQSATAAYGCADEEFDTKGRSLTEHNVSSVTHESAYIEIAPYYWDTSSRDERVDGWYHVRLTNGSTFVADRATVVGAGAYHASNEWKAGLSLIGHEDRLKLGGSDVVYVFFDVIDENGEVKRHTATLCPPGGE